MHSTDCIVELFAFQCCIVSLLLLDTKVSQIGILGLRMLLIDGEALTVQKEYCGLKIGNTDPLRALASCAKQFHVPEHLETQFM